MNRKVILYIACSVDGFIAKPNNNIDFLNMVHKEGEDYGYESFIQNIETVIMGRKTYDWIMAQVPNFPHADKECFIFTRTSKPNIGNTHFYSGSLKELIKKLKTKEGKNIFCDGGAETFNELLNEKLIDEFIISIIPIVLGEGIKLFKEGIPEATLKLISSKAFESGLVQLHYERA